MKDTVDRHDPVESFASWLHDRNAADDERQDLARAIRDAALLRGDFVLSSGRRSKYYFDKYLFETRPSILGRIARRLSELVPADCDRIAGPALGAVSIAAALSLETGLPFVIVRTDVKAYGTGRQVEGELHPGERVVLVEDVVTTGTQALRAANHLQVQGARVITVLAVVDREEGGAEAIGAAGLSYVSLFRRADLDLQNEVTVP